MRAVPLAHATSSLSGAHDVFLLYDRAPLAWRSAWHLHRRPERGLVGRLPDERALPPNLVRPMPASSPFPSLPIMTQDLLFLVSSLRPSYVVPDARRAPLSARRWPPFQSRPPCHLCFAPRSTSPPDRPAIVRYWLSGGVNLSEEESLRPPTDILLQLARTLHVAPHRSSHDLHPVRRSLHVRTHAHQTRLTRTYPHVS